MMTIDRHNYEECFILYWDSELTASQKQAVENFVKENQDLEEEFKILGQTRFAPDDNILLEKKKFLLNNSFINITNYEEQFLNYIDDEVTADQRKEIESFTGQYSVVKQELALLQKTKLQPEAEVIFPDKSILYRREEKVRVISMTWFRVAVAAAIILIAGFATIRLINTNKNGNSSVAKIDNTKDQSPVKKTDEKAKSAVTRLVSSL
jgi:anti-sigma factor RsiW